MVIIDDKGRIFGKINLFDFLFIVITLTALIALSLYYFVKEEPLKKINVVTVIVDNLRQQIIDDITVEDKLYNEKYYKKRPIATIKKIVKIEPVAVINSNTEGQLVKSPHPFLKRIVLEIKFAQPIFIHPLKQYFGNSRKKINVKIGSEFKMENYKYLLAGEIIRQESIPIKEAQPIQQSDKKNPRD